MPIRIAGAGCCLTDLVYPDVDFSSPAFAAMRSRRDGDGGLVPGKLVFAEDAERFGGRPFPEILRDLVDGRPPAAVNVGGPSVVALIHAAQMLEGEGIEAAYHGVRGADEAGERLQALLRRTPLDLRRYRTVEGRSPSTFVLSDPRWDSGRGERCFVNEIGAQAAFLPSALDGDFLSADIVALGGTALVPALHDGLQDLLPESRRRGGLSVVNTVFDFRAERRDPIGPWPLGLHDSEESDFPGPADSYRNCDLLVMDRDEALRLAGARGLAEAIRFFEGSGLGAFAVTRGAESVLAWARGSRAADRFEPLPLTELPVSARAAEAREGPATARGDTTGCGDAFAGGIIASLALQMKAGKEDRLDLAEAVSWGMAGGAFTLSILGGTYFESRPGEKRGLVAAYRRDWLAQTGRA